MAATWLPVHDRLLYPLNYSCGSTHDASVYLFHIIYSILVITLSLAIGIASLRFNLHSSISSKGLLTSTGLGASFGILILSQLELSSTVNLVIVGIGIALVAFYVPSHLVFWSQRFGRTAHKGMISDTACSVVLFEAVYALFLTFNVNPLILAIASPLVSTAMGLLCLLLCPEKQFPAMTPPRIFLPFSAPPLQKAA